MSTTFTKSTVRTVDTLTTLHHGELWHLAKSRLWGLMLYAVPFMHIFTVLHNAMATKIIKFRFSLTKPNLFLHNASNVQAETPQA